MCIGARVAGRGLECGFARNREVEVVAVLMVVVVVVSVVMASYVWVLLGALDTPASASWGLASAPGAAAASARGMSGDARCGSRQCAESRFALEGRGGRQSAFVL